MPVSPQPVTRASIIAGLQHLGISKGSLLEVHSSLKAMGFVEGGANAVIEALLETVGKDGAVVMPSYPVGPGMLPTAGEQARGITWKVRVLSSDDRETRTGMGAIADRFRERSDVVRNTNSFFSYTAWGKDAYMLSQSLEPLVERGGQVLLLGVQMDRCSSLHLAEERVALPEALLRLMDVPEEIQRDYPDNRWSIGFGPQSNFLLVQDEAEARGLIRTTVMGAAVVKMFDAKTVVELYEAMLRKNPYHLYGVNEQTL